MESRLEDATLATHENTVVTVGDNEYRLLGLFAERKILELVERHGVFVAERRSDSMPCMVKMRVQMHFKGGRGPSPNQDQTVKWAKSVFEQEIEALRITDSVRGTSKLLDHDVLQQTCIHERPGGYLNIIVTSKMPGKPVTDYESFGSLEADFIKYEVTRILEEMRLAGWKINEGLPDKVLYSPRTKTVSITGISSGRAQDASKSQPISMTGDLVHQYGQDVWYH